MNHNIPLSQSLIQGKALTLQFYEEWHMKKLQKKSLKLVEVGSWSLRKETISITEQVQGESESAIVDAATNYPEDQR